MSTRSADAPVRPSIPPVAWFAIATWAGCVLGEYVAWESAGRVLGAGALAVVFAAALTARLARRGAERLRGALVALRTPMVMATVGLVAGIVLSLLQWQALGAQLAAVKDCGAREWTGVVEADPGQGAYGTVVRVKLTGGPLDGARVRVGWPEKTLVPDLGRTVRFSAILKAVPLDEGWSRRYTRSSVCATGNAWVASVGRWRPGIAGPLYAWRAGALGRLHAVAGAGGDLAEGIVLGDRRRLIGTRVEEDFRVLGLTHLVAVSGSHLALACAAVAFLGRLARLRKRPLVITTVAAGAVYALVTGLPYSALRSLLMLAIAGAGAVLGRRGEGLASLSVAVVAVLVLEPWSVFDLGLQLSALAVAGLLVFGGLAEAWVTQGLTGPWRNAAGTLGLTLVAQFTTVPIVAAGFGMVSLLAPVANALAGPLVSLALLFGLGGVVVAGVLPDVGMLAVRVCASVLAATARIAELLAALPGAAVPVDAGFALGVVTVLGAAGLWLWWPVPKSGRAGPRALLATLLLSAVLALGPAPGVQASLTVLDVGQGDALLLRDRGRVMLVDTGGDQLALKRALARAGVRRIDALVLTHAHADHTAGASGLSGVATVAWTGIPGVEREVAYYPGAPRDFLPGDAGWRGPEGEVRALSAGDSWRLGDTTVRVLWPPKEPPNDLHTNDTSLVLQITRGGFDAVLTGDAEGVAQEGMIAEGTATEVEVLKVPHHGSTNGLTAEGLAAWSPQVALISVGADNDFGHPAPETLAMLGAAGVPVLRTDECGDITVEINEHGYALRTARRSERAALRARMVRTQAGASVVGAPAFADTARGVRGGQKGRRAAAGLSHLRRGGAAPRPRPPPPSRSHRTGGRPRLQLGQLRG